MSRCYRIQVSETLKQQVSVEDGIESPLELLDILPPEQMRGLLAAELTARGYADRGEGRLGRALEGGVEVVVDLEAGTVHVGAAADREVERTARSLLVGDGTGQAAAAQESALRQKLRRELAADVSRDEEALQAEITGRLEEALSGIRAELDAAVTRATAEALKQKARQLGEVQEIHEDPVTGAVTIRVRV